MLRWLWVLAVVGAGGGCGGKDGSARRAALVEIKQGLAAYEACLSGNRTGDFSEAVALTLAAQRDELSCAEALRGPLLAQIVQLAARVGVDRPTDAPFAPATLASGEAVCRDLGRLVGPVNDVAMKLGADDVALPPCHLDKLRVGLIESPIDDRPSSLSVEDGAVIAFAPSLREEDPRWLATIARLADAPDAPDAPDARWDVRAAPKRMHVFAWPAGGPVAQVWGAHAERELVLDDGHGGWRTAARASGGSVHVLLARGAMIALVGNGTSSVLRSSDGGKTLGKAATLWNDSTFGIETRLRADGTLISVRAGSDGSQLRAVRLAPEATVAVSTASFAWPKPRFRSQLELCAAGEVYWAVLGSHVVHSTDAGRSWTALPDLGTELGMLRLECTASLVIIISRPGEDLRQLRTCTATGCGPASSIAFPVGSVAGVQLAPVPTILIGKRDGADAFVLEAKRIELDRLVPTGVMIVTPHGEGDGVLRLGNQLVQLHGRYSSSY